MTGRTHDLAAFTALNAAFIFLPLSEMSLATLVVTLAANFIGGLAPDLDNSTTTLWKNMRGGKVIGQLLAPLLGGHRLLSHSILGIALGGFLVWRGLHAISGILLVDMYLVWWGFMIGFVSHIAGDAITKEGVPLLFPLGINFGFPPLRAFRITTGELFEKSLIYPGLMIANGYFFFQHSGKYLDFFQNYLR